MNCSTCHASKDSTLITFCNGASSFNFHKTKIIHSDICKWRQIWKESLLWQVCHLLLTHLNSRTSAMATTKYDKDDKEPISFPQLGKHMISYTVAKLMYRYMPQDECGNMLILSQNNWMLSFFNISIVLQLS